MFYQMTRLLLSSPMTTGYPDSIGAKVYCTNERTDNTRRAFHKFLGYDWGHLEERRSQPIAHVPYKYRIKLNGKEKQELRQAKRRGYKNARLVIRILIILLADAGKTIATTATILGCCEQTVLNQRQRRSRSSSDGLATQWSSGDS
jgi:hypothetical protein